MNIITLYRQTGELLKSVRLHALCAAVENRLYRCFFFLVYIYSALQLNFAESLKRNEREKRANEGERKCTNMWKWFTYNGINFIIAG